MSKLAVIITNKRGGHVKAARIDLADNFSSYCDKSPAQQMNIAFTWCMNHGGDPLWPYFDPKKHYIKIRFIQPNEE